MVSGSRLAPCPSVFVGRLQRHHFGDFITYININPNNKICMDNKHVNNVVDTTLAHSSSIGPEARADGLTPSSCESHESATSSQTSVLIKGAVGGGALAYLLSSRRQKRLSEELDKFHRLYVDSQLALSRCSSLQAVTQSQLHEAEAKVATLNDQLTALKNRNDLIGRLTGVASSFSEDSLANQSIDAYSFLSQVVLADESQFLFLRNRYVRGKLMQVMAEVDKESSTFRTRPYLLNLHSDGAVCSALDTYYRQYSALLLTGHPNFNNDDSKFPIMAVPHGQLKQYLQSGNLAARRDSGLGIELAESEKRDLKYKSQAFFRGQRWNEPRSGRDAGIDAFAQTWVRGDDYSYPFNALMDLQSIITESPATWTRVVSNAADFSFGHGSNYDEFVNKSKSNLLLRSLASIDLSLPQFWDGLYKKDCSANGLYRLIQPERSNPYVLLLESSSLAPCVVGHIDFGFASVPETAHRDKLSALIERVGGSPAQTDLDFSCDLISNLRDFIGQLGTKHSINVDVADTEYGKHY